MKRRDFIASGAGAAALTLGPGASAHVASALAGGAAPSFGKAAFAALVDQRFALPDGRPGASPVLAEVRDAPADDPRVEQFSLRFADPEARLRTAGIQTLQHPALGTFALYLVPADAGAASFRADFSLLA